MNYSDDECIAFMQMCVYIYTIHTIMGPDKFCEQNAVQKKWVRNK